MKGWLSMADSAEYAGVTRETIRAWMHEGLRHIRKNSRLVRIKPEWIDEFLEGFECKPEKFDVSKLKIL